MTDMPIIDPHQHFWDLGANRHPWLSDEPMIPFRYGDYSALKRNYLPLDYRQDSAGFDVVGTVYVEAEWDPADPVGETRWVSELAGAAGLPTAIVAQAWLHHEDAAEVLAAQAAFPRVRGIRQKPAAAPDPKSARRGAPRSMDDPHFRDGFSHLQSLGLSYDLQTPWWHLDAALELARDFPDTRIILNHTGLPADRSAEGLQGWRKSLAAFAEAPNAALKISGLGQPGMPWTVEANGPIVRDAIGMFGTSRCMFASNFPVDGLCADFRTIFAGFREITADLPEQERHALFHDNAKRIYSLR
ncbi:MAG: amidohydrolase family protein [Alphaproteobacteria bacterium]